MENIGSAEIKGRLAEILRRVRAGETFVITDNGEEAARLIPSARVTQPRMSVAAAVAAIRSVRPLRPLTRGELRGFIDEGRRF
jgi:prevent-host-death family protein